VEPIRTLCADPAWPFGDKLPGATRGAAHNYPVQTLDEIAAFLDATSISGGPVYDGGDVPDANRSIRESLAPDCRLFLWRVAAMQEEAFAVMRAWGFQLKSEIVWVKTSKGTDIAHDVEQLGEEDKLHFGMGRTVRMAHETCLIGVRGRPEVLNHSTRSVFFAPYTRHSEKPDVFYREVVERLSPGPYLELFARDRRSGWLSLGAELPVGTIRTPLAG